MPVNRKRKRRRQNRNKTTGRANTAKRSTAGPNEVEIPSHRHFANYVRFKRGQRSFYEKIQGQLNRRIPGNVATISREAVKHIWHRHGCYQNAKRQQYQRRNRGKMPSYFRNHRTMVNSIAATVMRPNWTRGALKPGVGGKRLHRSHRPKLSLPLRKRPFGTGQMGRADTRQNPPRRFYFKNFLDHIGYSGRGHGYRGVGAVADDLECHCCCVLLEGNRLVTAFPILTRDAVRKGVGEKEERDRTLDETSFESNSEVSSSISADEDLGKVGHQPKLTLAMGTSEGQGNENDVNQGKTQQGSEEYDADDEEDQSKSE